MSETAPVETKTCSNCSEQIPASKFMLHEAYCIRNLYKCECGEMVMKSEKEDHEEEKHQETSCQYCSFTALSHLFGDHESTCDQKPKLCQFCENQIPFTSYLDHVNKCGSRSRKCEFCHRNVMMRNQKYHEEEECAKFIREGYEKDEQERIEALEQEEARKERVRELQRKRREKKKEEEKKERGVKREVKGMGVKKEKEGKRSLPGYYGAKGGRSGISGRTRAKKSDNVAPSYYQPKTGSKRTAASRKEDEKEVERRSKPAPSHKKTKAGAKAAKKSSHDSHMVDVNVVDEIPPELLNDIYRQDLDENAVKDLQSQEYSQPEQPRAGERLVDENMDVDFARPPPRRPSPPPPDMRGDMPRPGSAMQTDEDMLQKAIQDSLRDNNPRQIPMSNDLDATMDDPEMLAAIARSMENN